MNAIQQLAVEYLVLILSQKDPTKDTHKLTLNRYQLGCLHPMMMTELTKRQRNEIYRNVSKITRWKLVSKEETTNQIVTLTFQPIRQRWLDLV